jgi:hypothetical protein
VVAVGPSPRATLEAFATTAGHTLSWPADLSCKPRDVVAWFAREPEPPFAMRPQPGRTERIRHVRKYAEGDLRWHSFYFRGPEGRLNLKAQNLVTFRQMAEGVDENTWMFHLRRGDFARWFRDCIKDPYLADETERVQRRGDLAPWQTRQLILELVSTRYTLPA